MHRFVRPIALIALALATAVAAAGCAKDEVAAAAAPLTEASAQAHDEAAQGVRGSAAAGDPAPKRGLPTQRKLIQNAELVVEVTSYGDARAVIDRQLADVKGYVANAEVAHHDGQVSRATLLLRIPADELATFLDSSASVGTVVRESLETQDITDQYYDIRARLRSAEKLEARLLELVASHTGGVKDLLEVERELARVREQIESMEGKLRLYDQQVAYSTLELVLTTSQRYAGAPPAGLMDRAKAVLGASWSALVTLGRGLVLMLAGLLPWLPLVLAAGWLLRRAWRRMVRRQRSRATARASVAATPWPAGAPMAPPVAPAQPQPAAP